MIDTVLFDFDGTLLNTNELIFASYEYAFQIVLNRSIKEEEIHSLYGRPLYSSLGVYGSCQDALYEAYQAFNNEHHDALVKKFPSAAEGVILLKEHGYKTAVVTSKRRVTMMRGIHILGLDDYFDVLITPEDTKKHKPDPAPVLAACQKLNTKPERAIMVGDSIFDFECGQRAGTYLAGVNYSTTREQLTAYRPLYMVDTILQLAQSMIKADNI